jgi:molybdate transport system regulatory protein
LRNAAAGKGNPRHAAAAAGRLARRTRPLEQGGGSMTLSARNQLPGTVKSVVLGAVMAEVVIDVGGQDVVSAITRHAAESLDIKAGDAVKAVIKSTEVMIEK